MDRWSQSGLFTIQTCGEKYRRRYIERERIPSGLAAKRGTAFHEVARIAHRRQKAASVVGDDPLAAIPSVEEAKDLAATAFAREIEAGVTLWKDEGAQEVGKAKDFAVNAAGLYVREVAPLVEPVEVERKVTITPRGWDLELTGVIDLVAAIEGGEEVRDQKTKGRRPPKGLADRSQQLTFYHMLRTAEAQRAPTRLSLVSMVQLEPTKTLPMRNEVVVQETTRTAEDVKALLARIRASSNAVNAGVFVPTSPEVNAMCSPRYCEFAHTCKYVRFAADGSVEATDG